MSRDARSLEETLIVCWALNRVYPKDIADGIVGKVLTEHCLANGGLPEKTEFLKASLSACSKMCLDHKPRPPTKRGRPKIKSSESVDVRRARVVGAFREQFSDMNDQEAIEYAKMFGRLGKMIVSGEISDEALVLMCPDELPSNVRKHQSTDLTELFPTEGNFASSVSRGKKKN